MNQSLLDNTSFGMSFKIKGDYHHQPKCSVLDLTVDEEIEADEEEGAPKHHWKPTCCQVSKVLAGSSAELFGFQVDDHLLSVGGEPVMTKRRCRPYIIPPQAPKDEDEDEDEEFSRLGWKTPAWKSHVAQILRKCTAQVKEAVENGKGTFIIERTDPLSGVDNATRMDMTIDD